MKGEKHMGKLYHSSTELIGGTPLLELTNYEKAEGVKAHLIGKLEYFNPAGNNCCQVKKRKSNIIFPYPTDPFNLAGRNE